MRTWRAATGVTTCGFCGCAIAEGQPVQEIHLAGIGAKFRCQAHAQGEVDWRQVQASKSSHSQPRPAGSGFVKASAIKAPFDPKAAQFKDE